MREQSLNMRLDWEEMLASPPGLMMIPESGYKRFSDPSKSVLRRSSLGSHLERLRLRLCIETSSLWAEFVNNNRCISVRLVSEEVKNFDNSHNNFL